MGLGKWVIGAWVAMVANVALGALTFVDKGGAWTVEGAVTTMDRSNNARLRIGVGNPPANQVQDVNSGASGEGIIIQLSGYTDDAGRKAFFRNYLSTMSKHRWGYLPAETRYCLYVIMEFVSGMKITYQASCSTPKPTISPRCDLTSPASVINMGSVPRRRFENVGDSSEEVAVEVAMECNMGTDVAVSVSGAQYPGNNALLALNPGGATGVGVKIRLGGEAATINGSGRVITANQGANVFQVSAQYVQTESSVSVGAANTSATLNLTIP